MYCDVYSQYDRLELRAAACEDLLQDERRKNELLLKAKAQKEEHVLLLLKDKDRLHRQLADARASTVSRTKSEWQSTTPSSSRRSATRILTPSSAVSTCASRRSEHVPGASDLSPIPMRELTSPPELNVSVSSLPTDDVELMARRMKRLSEKMDGTVARVSELEAQLRQGCVRVCMYVCVYA